MLWPCYLNSCPLCVMSTSIAVFGCIGEIYIDLFHVNFHCTLCPCYLNSYPLCLMSTSIAVFGSIDEIYIDLFHVNIPSPLCPCYLKVQVCILIIITWTLFYVNFHYYDFLMLFDNLHVTFKNSRKCPGYYEDFLWRLPIHLILTLVDIDFLMFYVNLHVTFRNSRMYPGYYWLPYVLC